MRIGSGVTVIRTTISTDASPEDAPGAKSPHLSAEGARQEKIAPATRQGDNRARFDLTSSEEEGAQMNEYDSGSGATPQKRNAQPSLDGKTQYLLRAEEELLQAISSHASLPKILNEICSALDFQIGNVVSLITLPGEDPTDLAAIAINAAHFGLHTFCSEGIAAENVELLGFLEMYCSVERDPTAEEVQLIERAKCLAAIAIKRHNEASDQDDGGGHGNQGARKRVLEWPASRN
jgi:hypothetical protein